MIYADSKLVQLAALLFVRREHQRREQQLRSEIDKIKARMAKRSFHAASHVIVNMSAADEQAGGPRRVIARNIGKWRGSTISGYLGSKYDSVWIENFRMVKTTFNKLVKLLDHSAFATECSLPVKVVGKPVGKFHSAAHVSYARAHTDPPTTRYRGARGGAESLRSHYG